MRVVAWFGDVNLITVQHKLQVKKSIRLALHQCLRFSIFPSRHCKHRHGANMTSKNPHHSESQKLESLRFASKKEVRARAHEMVDQLHNAPRSH